MTLILINSKTQLLKDSKTQKTQILALARRLQYIIKVLWQVTTDYTNNTVYFMRYERVFIIILAAFVLVSCSASKQTSTEEGTVTGRIFVVGNEPFTNLAIQTNDGKMILLRCDKKISVELSSMQGSLAKIKYNGTEQSPRGSMLKVVEYEIIRVK